MPDDAHNPALDTLSRPASGSLPTAPAAPGSSAGSSSDLSPASQTIADSLPQSALRVARLLSELRHDKPVVMLPDSGKTSAEAAAGLGCQVAQIAKSIIFRRVSDDAPVLVIASGVNRVDEAKVAQRVGALAKADARFVREKTGYAIGGVCPIGHAVKPVCLLDEDLFRHDALWAAAGHPHAVFELSPAQLQAMTQAPVADIALQAAPPAAA
jgi:prolyl-tRNA editing enzyme YbaK/EbsC (Cys-tRNA(Pro) deacylase)